MKQGEQELRQQRPKIAVRAIVAWLFVFAAFVVISNIVCRAGEPPGPGFVIRTPEDTLNGIRVSLVALLVSAAGAVIYRVPFTRPSILALAVGFAVINLDPVILGFDQGYSTLLEQVRGAVALPPSLPREDTNAVTATFALVAFTRDRLYLLHYVGYVLWMIVVLYSGYLGQYLAGFVLSHRQEERRESARFVAERAGIGLFASVVAGVLAILMASGLAAIVTVPGTAKASPEWYFEPTIAAKAKPRPAKAEQKPAASAKAAKVVDSAVRPNSVPVPRVDAQPAAVAVPAATPPAKAAPMTPDVAAARSGETLSGGADTARLFVYVDQERQRAYLLITALSFFVSAYIVGMVVRPRTSTWVACGAVVGVMVLPVAAIKLFLPAVEIETYVPLNAVDDVALVVARAFSDLMAEYGQFFRLLDLSPFTLSATAVVSALAGDWTAKTLLRMSLSRQRLTVFKPL